MISRPDPHDLIRLLAAATPAEQASLVIATVWSADGSTPLDEGARALVGATGLVAGTVGGGAAEAETLRVAPQIRHDHRPRLLECDLQGPGGEQPDPICGGRLRLLLEPLSPELHATHARAAAALDQRRRGLLHTTLTVSPDATVATHTRWLEASELATLPAHLLPSLAQTCLDRAGVGCAPGPPSDAGRTEILIQPVVPSPPSLSSAVATSARPSPPRPSSSASKSPSSTNDPISSNARPSPREPGSSHRPSAKPSTAFPSPRIPTSPS